LEGEKEGPEIAEEEEATAKAIRIRN